MFEPTPPEASLAIQRQRIRQLFTAGQLTAESATVQLLRLDIDAIVRARISPTAATRLDSEKLGLVAPPLSADAQ